MINSVEEYLEKKGWEFKRTATNQFQIKECPFCHDTRFHFYMNEEGLFYCFKCKSRGNFRQLQISLGDLDKFKSIKDFFSKEKTASKVLEDYSKFEENLWLSSEGLSYLKLKRGFEEETIKHFRLGLDNGWITIPHIQNGKVVNIKYRKIEKKEFKRVPGAPSILFNIDGLDFKKPSVLLVESETDAIAAWQMGLKNVVALTGGAGYFNPEWTKTLQRFKKIFICLNSDEAGQKGAYKIAEILGFKKCLNVVLPTKDVNDFLLERSASEFLKEFRKAKRFKMQEVRPLRDYWKEFQSWLTDEKQLKGIPTGFKQLDKIIGGLKQEDLIILSGEAGVGKTTFSLNLLLNFLQQGKRSLAFLLEGKLPWWILRLMTAKERLNIREVKKKFRELSKEFCSYELYFYSGLVSEISPNELTQLAEAAIKFYDIDFLLIDNLQKILLPGENYTPETAKIIAQLKNLAVDAKIPILLICHLRKPDIKTKRRKPTMYDLKSSSTIYQDADMVWMLWEKGKILNLEILKNRTGATGRVKLIFDKELGKFSEYDMMK